MAECKDCIHEKVCKFGSVRVAVGTTVREIIHECSDYTPTADVVEVVRCKDCKYHRWEQEPEHGKTIHLCSVLNAEVFKDFYCYHGIPKERGGDK